MERIKHTVAFKATPQEMQSIKKACLNLSKSMAENPIAKETFDVAEVGHNAYISATTRNGHTLFEIGMDNNQGSKAYTILQKNSKTSVDDFLSSEATFKNLARVYDSLKEAIKRAAEKDV